MGDYGSLVIDYQACVIDYTVHYCIFHVLRPCNSSLASGNRLPRLCDRLPEMESLKIPLLLACSGYETICVQRSYILVKESMPSL